MWPNLNNPPVKLALFQLKFSETNMKAYGEIDNALKNRLPIRKDNIAVGINLNNTSIPLGRSKLDGVSDAKIESYIYMSPDQKERVELLEDTATYVTELPDVGWDDFENKVGDYLSLLSKVLDNNEIKNAICLCNEIFAERNCLGIIANVNNPKGRSDDKYVATSHEYI